MNTSPKIWKSFTPFEGLYVTAVGPGIHEGRITVVLAAEHRPERQQEIKQFFGPRT